MSTFDRSGVLRTLRGYVPVTLMLLAVWAYIAIKAIDRLPSGNGLPDTWVFGAIALVIAARGILAALLMLGGAINPAAPALYVSDGRLILMARAFMSVPLNSIAEVTTKAWKNGQWSGANIELEMKGGKTRSIDTAILSTDPHQLVEDIRKCLRPAAP